MGSGHRRLYVNGVITQPPQLQCFIKGAHHKQGIMTICSRKAQKYLIIYSYGLN